jgi:hypothetical protein
LDANQNEQSMSESNQEGPTRASQVDRFVRPLIVPLFPILLDWKILPLGPIGKKEPKSIW